MIVIDDILESLRKEEASLDDALTDIRQRLAEEPDDPDRAQLYDRVDQSQQAGLPSPHARAIRNLLDETVADSSTAASDPPTQDDDMFELSLEPVDDPPETSSAPDEGDAGTEEEGSGETDDAPEDNVAETDQPPTLDAAEDTGSETESEDDGGLPPILSDETQGADSPPSDGPVLPAGQDRDENPPEADDSIPTADETATDDASGDESHDVVMETDHDTGPVSRENYGETLSERAVTTTTIIGALLGSRFELLTRISQDTYGTVYRARDHERDESNPEAQLCGVRVLPSRLAQQEAVTKRVAAIVKRIGKIKHPGVLTPIALHRDEEQAWVVTKLPVGSTLARFIRRECVKGLPAERTLKIVRRIGEALAAAHERGIPHGDLKPSSIFIDDKDNIRIADFGMRTALFGNRIASGQAGTTELEQMDPIEAYLSLEIMEGSPPEPSDDIYALGCITAALLTGGHPFNGQSGLRRLQGELQAPKIRSLSRHQNQVLQRALAAYRNERPEDVGTFLKQLETRRGKTPKLPLVVTVATLALIGAAWVPVMNYLEYRQEQHMIRDLQDAGWPGVRGNLRSLDPEQRTIALEALASELPNRYARAVENLLDDGAVMEAERLIAEARRYYPDHPELNRLANRVEESRDNMVAQAADALTALIESGQLGSGAADPDAPALLERLEQLAPGHALIDPDNLRPHFNAAAQAAANRFDADKAAALEEAAKQIFSAEDPIHSRMADALRQSEQGAAERVTDELLPSLTARLPADNLEQLRGLADDWRTVLRMTGGHPLLDQHEDQVADILETALRDHMDQGQWEQANGLLRELGFVVPTARLQGLREDLTRRQLADNYRPDSLRAERRSLQDHREGVTELLDEARMTPVWHGELLIAWREMITWLRPGRSWLDELRDRAETLYLESIREHRAANDSAAAADLLQRARRLLPESEPLASTEIDNGAGND